MSPALIPIIGPKFINQDGGELINNLNFQNLTILSKISWQKNVNNNEWKQ